jgi:hypothetical protein
MKRFLKSLIIGASTIQFILSAKARPALPNLTTISNTTSTPSNSSIIKYNLVDKFSGETFFDNWDFWNYGDPTHGLVNYLSQSDAVSKNLTYVQPDGTVVLAVDDYTWLNEGEPRNSVRVSSKKTYNGGLFIMDAWCKFSF